MAATPAPARVAPGAPRKRTVHHRRPLRPARLRVAAAAVAAGALLVVGGMWPTYAAGGKPIVDDLGQVLFHGLPLVAWAAGAALLASGRERNASVGAALAGGSLAVVGGFDLATLGHLIDKGFGPARLGMWLGFAGAAVALAGVGAASRMLSRARPGRRRWVLRPVCLAIATLAAAAATVGSVPGWERYTIVSATLHRSQSVAVSSGYANAWEVIVGEAVASAALALTPLVAAAWRDRRVGGALALGAVTGMAGLVALSVYQVTSPVSPSTLGLTAAQVSTYKVTISTAFEGWFWVEVAGLAAVAAVAVASMALGWVRLPKRPLRRRPALADAAAASGGPAEETGL